MRLAVFREETHPAFTFHVCLVYEGLGECEDLDLLGLVGVVEELQGSLLPCVEICLVVQIESSFVVAFSRDLVSSLLAGVG